MNHFYEDILRVVGECGPWQVRRLVLLWLLMLMCGAHYTIIDYIELNTEEFVCSYGECQDFDTSFFAEEDLNVKDKVLRHQYDHVFPRLLHLRNDDMNMLEEKHLYIIFCEIFVPEIDENGRCSWNVTEDADVEWTVNNTYICEPGSGNQFVYNPKIIDRSVSGHFGLICDNFEGQFLIQIIIVSGNVAGSIIGMMVGKYFGRRVSFIMSAISMTCGFIIQIASLNNALNNFILYLVGTFFICLGNIALFQQSFLYISEIIGFRKPVFTKIKWFTYNSLLGVTSMLPWYTGKIFIAIGVDSVKIHFSTYVYISAGVTLLSFPIIYFLPESPRWLLSKYDISTARKILRQIAKENKKDVDIRINLVPSPREKDVDGARIKGNLVHVKFNREGKVDVLMEYRQYPIWTIFTRHFTNTVTFTWCWLMLSATYHLIYTYTGMEQESTFLVRCGLEVSGVVLVAMVEGITGRRRLLVLLEFLSAVALSASHMVTHLSYMSSIDILTDEEEEQIVTNLFNFLAFSSAGIKVILLWYSLSLYPKCMREICFGLSLSFLEISVFLSQLLIPLLQSAIPIDELEDPGEVNFLLSPRFLLSFGVLVAALLCFYLPEILNFPLPDTFDDLLILRQNTRRKRFKPKYEVSSHWQDN